MFKQFFLREKNMMVAIAINSIIIFLLYFPQINEHSHELYKGLEYIDLIFVLVFLIEAIVKIRHFGFKNYLSDKWNIFDFFIVIVSMPALLTFFPFFTGPHTSFVKILRLGRMVRLFRFLSFIPRMEIIMVGLSRAIKASVFVMIALVFLNFILALFTCHFYSEIAPEYFYDPAVSMYYIFQLFTIEGWNEIPQVVIDGHEAIHGEENASSLFAGATRFYFILVVLAGGIFGMSLANAVFVDEMTSDNNKEVEDKLEEMKLQISELKEMLKERG